MKAIIEKNKEYKVTGERGDFWITEDVKGKGAMFAKRDVTVVELEKMTAAKTYRRSSSKMSKAAHNAFLADMAFCKRAEHQFV